MNAATPSHLRALRERFNVPLHLVVASAGTTLPYLAKVESGVITPSRSYVAKVTEAIVKLMQDPPRPCPVIGCDNTKHIDRADAGDGSATWHHADSQIGEGWTVNVERFDGQDTEWSVYAFVESEGAFAPADFLAFTTAYKKASALAATLNGRGAVI